jgi:hypothetical protein
MPGTVVRSQVQITSVCVGMPRTISHAETEITMVIFNSPAYGLPQPEGRARLATLAPVLTR